MSANRIVVLCTPFAALLAGVVADWTAKNAPGVEVSATQLEGVFLGGIAAVVAPAVVWLLGWQKHEAREAAAGDRADAADLAEATADEAMTADEAPGEADALIDPVLESGDPASAPVADGLDLDGFGDEGFDDDLFGGEDLFGDEDLLGGDDLGDEDDDEALTGPTAPQTVA